MISRYFFIFSEKISHKPCLIIRVVLSSLGHQIFAGNHPLSLPAASQGAPPQKTIIGSSNVLCLLQKHYHIFLISMDFHPNTWQLFLISWMSQTSNVWPFGGFHKWWYPIKPLVSILKWSSMTWMFWGTPVLGDDSPMYTFR